MPLGSLRDRGRLSLAQHQCLQAEPGRSTDPLGKKVFTPRSADIPRMAGTYSDVYKMPSLPYVGEASRLWPTCQEVQRERSRQVSRNTHVIPCH